MAIHKFKLDCRVASYCMSRGVHAEPLQSLKRGIYYLTMYMVNTAFLMVTPMILTIFQLVVSKYFELKFPYSSYLSCKRCPNSKWQTGTRLLVVLKFTEWLATNQFTSALARKWN